MIDGKEYIYISEFNEALFCLGSKIIEIAENYPKNQIDLRKVDKDGNCLMGEGWSISNYFSLNGMELLISLKIFEKVMGYLSSKKIVTSSLLTWHNLSEIFELEKRSPLELYELGIKDGQRFPTAPLSDINNELIINFQLLSKKELIKNLPPQSVSQMGKSDKKDRTIFEVSLNKIREIKINGVLLSKPDFHSKNDIAFSHIYEHPNTLVKRKDIHEDGQKNLLNVIDDLGFEKELKELFFSNRSKDVLFFINPVTQRHLEQNEYKHLKKINIKKIIDQIRAKRIGSKGK